MNNTVNNTKRITISISLEQVLKSVYAESACLALMSDNGSRPPILSSDNRRLLSLFCRNAWMSLACELAGSVDAKAFSIPDDDDSELRLPLVVETDATAATLRHYAERYLAATTLADCYAAREAHAAAFARQAASALAALKLSLAATGRRSCWV